MKVLHSANYVKDGVLHYIVSISQDCVLSGFDGTCTLDGGEKIVHNGDVHSSLGDIGIPAISDTNFYTVYP